MPSSNKFSIRVVDITVSEPICNKSFNYNKFNANLDVARFLAKYEGLPFECYSSPASVGNYIKKFPYGPKHQEAVGIDLSVANLEYLKNVSGFLQTKQLGMLLLSANAIMHLYYLENYG